MMRPLYLVMLAGLASVIYGLAEGKSTFAWIGVVALIVAALIRRMKGHFRLRADSSGIEIEGTVIPPPEDPTPEQPHDE